MERLKKYIFVTITILFIGYIYNYIMEISSVLTDNRKILLKINKIESKIDNFVKNNKLFKAKNN